MRYDCDFGGDSSSRYRVAVAQRLEVVVGGREKMEGRARPKKKKRSVRRRPM